MYVNNYLMVRYRYKKIGCIFALSLWTFTNYSVNHSCILESEYKTKPTNRQYLKSLTNVYQFHQKHQYVKLSCQ